MIVLEAMTQVAAIMPAAPGGSEDVVGWVDGLVGDVRNLGLNAARAVIVIGLVIGLYKAKLSFVPSLASIAVAAFLWWMVGNFSSGSVQDKIDGTVTSSSVLAPSGPVVQGEVLAGARVEVGGSS